MIRVITGHICSGKSHHVSQHAKRGDVIIDMDRIAASLTTDDTPSHEYGEVVIGLAKRARMACVEHAMAAHWRDSLGQVDGSFNVWIVHAYPDDFARGLYAKYSATIVRIDADAATLLERAAKLRPPAAQAELKRRLGVV